jgi:large subunit ribosomal protein L21
MYAVIKINGKQQLVRENEVIKIDRVAYNAEESLTINEVLAVGEGENLKFGAPYVNGATVTLQVLENKKDKKIIVFKKKRRKRYEVKNGHRQHISVLRVLKINA